ncbi:MAG: nucleoside hydrolase [Gemmatimonadetes bacterium]|nr:nucleoside hydrolase [Gemmatimonadota bacterium]
MADVTRVIVDTDAGIDDVVALAVAALSPELEIVAVTTTYGNTTLDYATGNATKVLTLVGREDVNVFAGASRPLKRDLVTAPETHGETGVGYAATQPAKVDQNHRALLDALQLCGGSVVLVTLGPLTNLANALAHSRTEVESKVTRHIGMFGSLSEKGCGDRWADFNCWSDPEASSIVINSRLNTEMVGLDVTRKMTLSADEVTRLTKSTNPVTRWLGMALKFYVESHRKQRRLDGCVINDVLPVGELISPGLLEFGEQSLRVALTDDEHRGRTMIDNSGTTVKVAKDVQIAGMRRLLARAFGSDWSTNLGEGK